MKNYILLISIFFFGFANSQEDDKRGEPVTLHVPANQVEGPRTSALYPGCGDSQSMIVSTCFTNLVTRDLQTAMESNPEFEVCEDIPLTLELSIDKKGNIVLNDAYGPKLNINIKIELFKAVDHLNDYLNKNDLKIIPATLNEEPIEVTKNIPFILKGRQMKLVDTFEDKGTTFHVFEKCEVYYIKDKSNLHTLLTIHGKDKYEAYKQKLQEAVVNVQNP